MASLTQFVQTPGVGGGQGSLACCSPWGHKESDTTEGLNSNRVRGSQKSRLKTIGGGRVLCPRSQKTPWRVDLHQWGQESMNKCPNCLPKWTEPPCPQRRPAQVNSPWMSFLPSPVPLPQTSPSSICFGRPSTKSLYERPESVTMTLFL